MGEGRYHVTEWNWFYQVFFTQLKKYERGGQNFQPILNIIKVLDVVGVCV
jgi:hypothetical protein